jgi:hypothetical protein
VSGYLVGSTAFKAAETGDPRLVGSIPIHLRQFLRSMRRENVAPRVECCGEQRACLHQPVARSAGGEVHVEGVGFGRRTAVVSALHFHTSESNSVEQRHDFLGRVEIDHQGMGFVGDQGVALPLPSL